MYNFSAVHAVQTSTETRAAMLRQQNPEVAAFHNAATRLPDLHNYAAPERLSELFAGLNREDD